MNNEKILKKKIEFYLITPIFVSLFLILMCGALYFFDRKCAVIATVSVVVVILIELLVYVVTKKAVMPTLISFSFEQGQIQKELLKELGITEEYEGIGHCALGYAAEPARPAAPRKENYVYYIK